MEILWKNKNVVVVYKAPGVPSQPDPSGDADAITLAAQELIYLGEPDELYLVHRLDRVVGGIIIFARNKRSAAELSELVSNNRMGKTYLAVIDGYLESGNLKDFLYKDAKVGKSFVVDRKRAGVKCAELSFSVVDSVKTDRGVKTLIKVNLKTGRFHQIRTQFASRKVPLTGDGKYGSKDNKAHMPALFAYRLSFEFSGDSICVKKLPDITVYPWNLFDRIVYGDLIDD